MTLVLLLLTAPPADAPLDVKTVLAEMAANGKDFDSARLNEHGAAGLERLLDALWPDTVAPVGPAPDAKEIDTLLARLGDDDAKKRQAAVDRLIRFGKPYRDRIAARAKDPDPDVQLRALAILKAWEPRDDDLTLYAAAFEVYLNKIGDAERLMILARRLVRALEAGMPTGGRLALVRLSLQIVSRAGDDRYNEVFKPLLKHADVAVPRLVLERVGAHGKGNTYYPQLLIDATYSDRREVVRAAVDSGPNCWDEKRAPALKRALRRLLQNGDDEIKFRVSFTLMHDFDDADAYRHILAQVDHKDPERVLTAIYWIGDSCNSHKPLADDVFNKLTPFLKSTDEKLRRAATSALATYDGEKVVRAILPMLADPVPIIVELTGSHLLDQTDRKMLKRVLAEAAEKHELERVRDRARGLLMKVDEK